jgi:hypothetical protein
MNKEIPNGLDCTSNKILPIFLVQLSKRIRFLTLQLLYLNVWIDR